MRVYDVCRTPLARVGDVSSVALALMLTSLVLLFVIAVTFAGIYMTETRYSFFYDVDTAQARQEFRADENEAAAARIMTRLIHTRRRSDDSPTNSTIGTSPSADICAILVTVPRSKRYLYQSLASLLLSNCDDAHHLHAADDERICCRPRPLLPGLVVNVLFCQHEAQPHNDFTALQRTNVNRSLVRALHVPRSSTIEGGHKDAWQRDELEDYAMALQSCHDAHSQHRRESQTTHRAQLTVVLEDDIVSTERAMDKLLVALQPILRHNDWLFVRLYRSAYWDGWERTDWPILVAITLTAGMIYALSTLTLYARLRTTTSNESVTATASEDETAVLLTEYEPQQELMAASIVARNARSVRTNRAADVIRLSPKSAAHSERIPNSQFVWRFVVIVSLTLSAGGLTVAFLLLIGKQNIPNPFATTGLQPSVPSAGTVAMVFAAQHIPALLSYLRDEQTLGQSLPIDVTLNQYIQETHLKQYHLIPDLFDHRGVYSTAQHKNQGRYEYMKVSSTFKDETKINLYDKNYNDYCE